MKTIVITGSTRGIGRGLAEEFLKLGCNVVISGRSSDTVAETIMNLAKKYSPEQVHGCACDINKVTEIQAMWDQSKARFGQIDYWINNAGMSIPRAHLVDSKSPDLKNIVATNLTGVLLSNQIVLKGMLEQDAGQIWNMEGFGSDGATQPGMVAYGATKRAVNYLNSALQKEVKGTNVMVNTLSPGIVVTELLLGDYDLTSAEWQKSKKIFNILADTVETVAPFLAKGVLAATKSGTKVAWLTNFKAFRRFMGAAFNKRDLFKDYEINTEVSKVS
ncbi:SDR family oxidoreductase [Paraferrimonas sp. SM1919]|uniref:SDR family NAD(P)-dependent oxidoreductase n=1 Tax=Paraferrimonas sp. SM1919 TaxID=2662263 RepID=UPI0013D50733|nr:SDR family oxidoreductase [Paraferrimonas sp. SM1919]